jgi:hypothetical protein
MKKFSDFGVDPLADKDMFPVPKVSIEEVIDREIEVLGFVANVKTEHGGGRYILKIRCDEVNGGNECKFFTTAKAIQESLEKIGKDGLPFTTTIRMRRDGKWKLYYFT